MLNRTDLIYHSLINSEKDPLYIYWTKDPNYKDLVIVDITNKEMRIPTEHMLYLIQIFANHLNTQISTQNVSSISSRKSQIPESGS